MEPILNFAQLTAHLKKLNHRKRIAVVCANDPNTEYAISRALEEGIAEFLMIGDSTILKKYPTLKQYPEYVKTIHIENSDEAAREAVRTRRGSRYFDERDYQYRQLTARHTRQRKRVVAERKNPHAFGSDGNSYLS